MNLDTFGERRQRENVKATHGEKSDIARKTYESA